MPPRRRRAWKLPEKAETCSDSPSSPKPKPSPSPTTTNTRRSKEVHWKHGELGFEEQLWQEGRERGSRIFARHSEKVSALQSSRKREEAEKPRVRGRGGNGVEGGGGGGAGRLLLPRRGCRGVGGQRGCRGE